MEKSFDVIKLKIKDRIGEIVMNRPEKRNALSPELIGELKMAFRKLEEMKEVKVVILSGQGKAFSAGADLKYLQSLQDNSYDENLDDSRSLRELFEIIYFLNKPVIAKVTGHAIAGGCGLATVCDLVFSVPDAKFGFTEVRIGFVPAIVMTFLIRKVGEAKAKELLLTGKLIEGNDARDMGLVNFLVDPAEIESKVQEFCLNLCSNASDESLKLTKKMIVEIQSMDILKALDYAAEKNAESRSTADCKKGIAAFLNKEKIEW